MVQVLVSSQDSLEQQFLSLPNFRQAWEKVSQKKGSAGIDEETIDNFATHLEINLGNLISKVANGTYSPLPCKQVLIPKGKDSYRELKIPTVRDRIVQQALLNVLSPIAEEIFSPVSFAYRPNLSYLNAVEQVAYWRDLGYLWVLDADIQQYFDSIDHARLLREVRKYFDNSGVLCLMKSWISGGVATEEGVVRSEKGIPQGAVISPLLANLYLQEFDEKISALDVQLVRYADDFVVLARTKDDIIQATSEVERILRELGLKLNAKKTQITSFSRGFRFLGHGFLDNAIFPLESAKSSQNGSKKKHFRKKRYRKRP